MTPERWSHVKRLFHGALELPPAERAAFLAKECAGDNALLEEARSLLQAHEHPGAFMEASSVALNTEAFAVASTRRIGERIGAYRISAVLGAGGMGEVYKAIRDDDQYRAEVAIKLMRSDMRSSMIEERFKTERQILAALDHRNIARLLDGGTTSDGIPYVVMELVQGEAIDRYCDQKNLGTRQRVNLFLQVCAAVSYAHQHLVVHRDLKPNNILVTADGSVKLLDFGIAKLLESNADTKEVERDETVTSMRAMTIEYASPEQVSGGVVTTVSDVYSLGVVLYRLLTGQSPYGARKNDTQRVAEILSDTSPAKPSAAATKTESIRRELKGDLDDVLLMALRKEPHSRYGSVDQFATDLRNYLAGMPVQARGNALRYRVSKFVKRHKVEMVAACLVVVALVSGIVVSTREARIAEEQRQIAQRHFDSVRKLANTLLFDFNDQIEEIQGATKARDLLLKTSLEYLNSLYAEAGSDRALREELAIAFKKVGDLQGKDNGSNQGDPKAAIESYGKATALLASVVAQKPSDMRAGRSLSNAYVERARLLMITGDSKAALDEAERGMVIAEAMKKLRPDDVDAVLAMGAAYAAKAELLQLAGHYREGLEYGEKMVALAEARRRSEPNNVRTALDLSAAYNTVANYYENTSAVDRNAARPTELRRAAMNVDQELLALEPSNERYLWSLAATRVNLALSLHEEKRYDDALEQFRLALPPFAAKAADVNDLRARFNKSKVEISMADTLLAMNRLDEARETLEKNVQIVREIAKRGSTVRIEFTLSQIEGSLGALYSRLASEAQQPRTQLEKWRKALAWYHAAVPRIKKVGETVTLEGSDKAVLDNAVAGLARAEAALAKLGK